jgi:lipid-binding SYLF domain-containing protein
MEYYQSMKAELIRLKFVLDFTLFLVISVAIVCKFIINGYYFRRVFFSKQPVFPRLKTGRSTFRNGKEEIKTMQKRVFKTSLKSINAFYLLILTILVFTLSPAATVYADKATELDGKVDAALDRFYKHVKDGKQVAAKADGLLVMPSVKKGALIIGGEYGRGALRIGGKTVGYYSMVSGSVGLQIGGQAKDLIIAYMSSDALKKFRDSKGWTAGVDGNVALITVGAGESAMTAAANKPIVAFVFDVKGLIADMSLKGAKFNKLDLSK